MSSERHDRGFHRNHHPPSGPGPVSSQWSERHYQGYQTPHISPETTSSQQYYTQDPRWGSGAQVNVEPHRVPAGPERRREQERRRVRAHPQPHGDSYWTEHLRYSENGEGSEYFCGRTSLPRVARGGDLGVNQGYAPANESHPVPLSQRNGSDVSMGRRDEHAWSWAVRDEHNDRGAYREEQQGPSRESSRVYYSSGHRGTVKDQQGDSHQPHYEEEVYYRAPRRHENELQGSPSEWEEDIQNMLPSQVDLHKGTLRFRGSVRGRRASHGNRVHAWEEQEPEDEPMAEAEMLEALDSLRDQPWALHLRRETKNRLSAKLANTEVKWYSTQPVAKAVRKGGSSLARVLQANYIWRNVLKRIEGRFGSSVYAFFNFLRAMIQLNLVLSLVVVGGVVVPSILLAGDPGLQEWGWMAIDNSTGNHDPCLDFQLEANEKFLICNENYTKNLKEIEQNHELSFIKLVQDFLQGTGLFEWTFLFAGRYPASAGDSSYLASLAYLLSVFTAYFISFVFVVYFVAKFFRQIPLRLREKSTTFANIVFTGWDFTVRGAEAARTVHICITGEVKTAFDDNQFLQRKLRRTKREYVTLFLTRACVNVLVAGLIIGGWVGIYFLVDISQKNIDGDSYETFFWEYAPTVTVAAFNFLYPLLFTFVVQYEHYRGHTELLVTLIRSVFVRLTSLVVLISTKLIVISQESRNCDPEDPYICWETHLGQQVYSVFVLDAILQCGMTFVVDVTRKALGRFNSPLLKTLSQIEFFVPGHVLDVVYLQCICWLSIIHAPVLFIVCSLYFCLLFFLKLFTVSVTCVPATRVFRASRSSAMFMTILCLAFLLCLVPNGMALLYLRPSLACSPFRGLDYSWQVLTYYICGLTGSTYWIRWVVFAVDEAVVVGALIVIVLLLLVYYLSLVSVRNALIRRLEKKLKLTSNDKVFLMNQQEQQRIPAPGQM
ncbi:transmembrane channel-like protein 7 [Scylla paramamosain]|uniref:transmembrane channel-like protein 7 n=1 Tax=Scylla paramamosain TaxID=85552 RepID=UPI003083CE4F